MDIEVYLLMLSMLTFEFCSALTLLSRHCPLNKPAGQQRLQKLLETMLIIGCWI